MTPATRARLQGLVEQWQDAADYEYNNANREYASALDQCASDIAACLAAWGDGEPKPELLQAAIADRDARPWRYYRFEWPDAQAWMDKQADTIRTLAAERDKLAACLAAEGEAEVVRTVDE
jgi:hypothetical protein